MLLFMKMCKRYYSARKKKIKMSQKTKRSFHLRVEYIDTRETNEVVYGNGLKAFPAALYGQGVQSLERMPQLISMVTGKVVRVSQGSIQNWLCEFHKKAGSEIEKITGHLLDHACVHTDGTNVTQDDRRNYPAISRQHIWYAEQVFTCTIG